MEPGCLETGWCDLSEEHRRIRVELEGLIRSYVEGGADEYWMPVVVAPYGSGKTTLLRHLETFAKSIGAAALRVELADIVEYIVERYGSVHESELPRILEEYAREKLGEASGVVVLLVDEVEESYDLLRGIVEYETSPFRGVAEAIRTHSTKVYVVLALGPSSTLKEAVFGPVAWRSRIFTLPLLPKPVIERMVVEILGGELADAASLLANMVWWASKGRIAWARMLVDTVVGKLAAALKQGPEHVETVLLGEEALAREIVEGVPLFDKTGYREVRRLIEDKKMIPLLAVLPGPVPLSLLSRLLGYEVLPEANLAVVYSKTAVRVEDLLSEAEAWMTRYARAKGFQASSVEHAVSALEHAALAWSRDGLIVYDPQALRELFTIAADVAREIYGDDPHAAQLIEALNPDLLSPPIERFSEPVAALRPSMVARLYPMASSSPLVGCARRTGPSQVVEVVNSLALGELMEYSSRLSEFLGLNELLEKRGLKLVVAPARSLQSYAQELACKMLSGEPLVVLVIEPDAGRREKQVPRLLEAAAALTGSLVVEAGPRLSLFVYSLLYGFSIATAGCLPENLTGHDRRTVNLYADLLRSLVIEVLASKAGQELASIETRAHVVEQDYGEIGYAVAALIRDLGPEPAGKIVSELATLQQRARSLAEKASRIAGVDYSASRTKPVSKAYSSIAEIYEELEEKGYTLVGRVSPSCGERGQARGPSIARLVAILLGLEEYQPEAGLSEISSLAERLAAYVEHVPRAGVLEEAANIIEEMKAIVSKAEEIARSNSAALSIAAMVVSPIGTVASKLAEDLAAVYRIYGSLEANLEELPDKLRKKALEAITSDLSNMSSLAEAVQYLSTAVSLVNKLKMLSEKGGSGIEELKSKIIEAIDRIISSQPLVDQARKEAREEAIVG
ncbi:hypothetical protein [Pyrodictium delaneyi]|uniref:Uncharacterized protein n=1 Tax=Pyrodictium delaneyi TaxID=1273541 RepID=A0A211YP67_9CREN|nr:hypothetical protein [Pyrodictium delaneyi]OWJ54751.1 hypothetical protein Pdsh_03215 [Pyrodictium delaneyi]